MIRGATKRAMLVLAFCSAACARHRAADVAAHPVPPPAPLPSPAAASAAHPAITTEAQTIAPELASAIGARVADLKARGGVCEEYGEVLESALATGRITLRPYMWRVDGNLASAQGESTGEMTIARDIDSLNVGVRRLDDVLRSAEHEAAHIALRIASGDPVREARVDERVNGCRSALPR